MSRYPIPLAARLPRVAVIIALTLTTAGAAPVATVAEAVEIPVTIMGAGDIAGSLADATATGNLIRAANPDAVFTLGDNAYSDGTLTNYTNRYDPAWGSFKDRTHPVPGNHDYHADPPVGYLAYFGAATVTTPVDGGVYYAWDVGNGWRAYAVNTEISTSGAQLTWLQDDVAAHPGMHYILYTHHPRYTSGANHGPSTAICPLWNALAATGGLEIVLAGHNHQYERFAEMDCAGQVSDAGARSFVVGSGGTGTYAFGPPEPGSRFRNARDFGVLELVLHSTSYEWSFIASGRGANGSTSFDTDNAGRVLDSGSVPTQRATSPGTLVPSGAG
jgi:predicted phosphodiesterase